MPSTHPLHARIGLAAAALAASAAGCATDPLAAIGIPPLRPRAPLAASPPAAGAPAGALPASDVCRQTQLEAPVDIDTVYARAMSRFGFRTVEERKHAAATHGTVIDADFRHVAQPGVYYRLADRATLSAPGEPPRAAFTTLELMREAPARTRVRLGWCLGPRQPRAADPAYHVEIEQTFRAALAR